MQQQFERNINIEQDKLLVEYNKQKMAEEAMTIAREKEQQHLENQRFLQYEKQIRNFKKSFDNEAINTSSKNDYELELAAACKRFEAKKQISSQSKVR